MLFDPTELSYPALLGIAYLFALNFVTLVVYIVDKARAGSGGSRVPESTLLGLAMVGGAAGALLGMLLVRHKTRKWYFRFTVPVMLTAQVALIAWLALGAPAPS